MVCYYIPALKRSFRAGFFPGEYSNGRGPEALSPWVLPPFYPGEYSNVTIFPALFWGRPPRVGYRNIVTRGRSSRGEGRGEATPGAPFRPPGPPSLGPAFPIGTGWELRPLPGWGNGGQLQRCPEISPPSRPAGPGPSAGTGPAEKLSAGSSGDHVRPAGEIRGI